MDNSVIKSDIPKNTRVTITAQPNEGRSFVSWSDGNTQQTRTISVSSNMNLTAVFSVNNYNIRGIGPHGTINGCGTFPYGTKIQLTAVPDEGYVFVGWSDGTSDQTRDIIVESSVTYVAAFKKIIKVTYVRNDVPNTIVEREMVESISSKLDKGGCFVNPTGKRFDCWTSNSDGTGTSYAAGQTIIPNSDITLYAKWKDAPTSTLTYVYNSTQENDTVTAEDDTDIILINPVVIPSGYCNPVWYTDSRFDNIAGKPGQSFPLMDDTTLYCKWTDEDHPFDSDVEHLIFTGIQWINIGYKANTTRTRFVCEIVPQRGAASSTTFAIFGSRNSTTDYNSSCAVFIRYNAFRLDWTYADGAHSTSGVSYNTPYIMDISRPKATVNDTVYQSAATGSVDQRYDFLIGNFSNASTNTYAYGFTGLLKWAKIYTDDELTMDLKGVRIGTDGYLFDKIGKGLYGNSGAGKIDVGNDVG